MADSNDDKPKVSKKGTNFVAGWEGFLSCPYLDKIADPPVWTIGYGETKGVGPNTDCISKEDAKKNLKKRLTNDFLAAVPRKNKMKQHERDAMASFAYNCGVGAVSDPDYSTLARRLKSNEGKKFEKRKNIYRDELKRWDKAGGQTVEGLTKRRKAETELACKGDYSGRP